MITYFDSSSIIKWFFDEPYMELSRDVKNKTTKAFTSFISFPEVISAINRACNDGRCLKSEMETVRDEFVRIWPNFILIKLNEHLIQKAGQLIFKHNLRGFDAIHLSTALLLKEEGNKIDIFFSSFDRNLNRAAYKEGLLIHKDF